MVNVWLTNGTGAAVPGTLPDGSVPDASVVGDPSSAGSRSSVVAQPTSAVAGDIATTVAALPRVGFQQA